MENLIDITEFYPTNDPSPLHSPPPSAISSRFSTWHLLTPNTKTPSTVTQPLPTPTQPADIPLPQTPAPRVEGHGRSLSTSSATSITTVSQHSPLNAKALPFEQPNSTPTTLPVPPSLIIKRSKTPPSFFSEPTLRSVTLTSNRGVTSPTARGQWWTAASDGGVLPTEEGKQGDVPSSPLRYGVEESWGDGGGYEGRDGLMLTGMKAEFAFPERKKVVIRSAEVGEGDVSEVVPLAKRLGDQGGEVNVKKAVSELDDHNVAIDTAENSIVGIGRVDVTNKAQLDTGEGEAAEASDRKDATAGTMADSEIAGAALDETGTLPSPDTAEFHSPSLQDLNGDDSAPDESNPNPERVRSATSIKDIPHDLMRALSFLSLSTSLCDDNVTDVCADDQKGEGVRAYSPVGNRLSSPICSLQNTPTLNATTPPRHSLVPDKRTIVISAVEARLTEEGDMSPLPTSEEERRTALYDVDKHVALDTAKAEIIDLTLSTPGVKLAIRGSREDPVVVVDDMSPLKLFHIEGQPDMSAIERKNAGDTSGMSNRTVRDTKDDIIADMEDQVQQLQDAHTVFISGFEEIVYRLRSGIYFDNATSVEPGSTSDRLLHSKVATLASRLKATRLSLEEDRAKLSAAETEQQEMKDRLAGYEADQARHALMYNDLKEAARLVEGDREKVWDDLQLSEKRRKALVEKYLKTEDEHKEMKSKLGVEKGGDGIALVMIEGEGRVFDPEMVRKGYDGGGDLVNGIVDKVDQVCDLWLDTAKPKNIQIMLFLDIPEVSRALVSAGILERGDVFRGFLDGIQEAHPLVAVIDIGGRYGASSKIKEQLKLYSHISLYKKIFLVASSSVRYEKCLEGLRKDGGTDKLHAIRSTHSKVAEAEPFAQLGQDKLVPVECLFSVSLEEWQDMVRSKAGEKVRSLPRSKGPTPSGGTVRLPPTSRPRPVTPPRSRQPSNSRTLSQPSQVRSNAPSPEGETYQVTIPSSPPYEIKPAPWASYHGPIPTALPPTAKPKPAPSIASSGGSLLDQFYDSRVSSPTSGSILQEVETESAPSTPKARRHYAFEQPARTRTGPGIIVPIDPSIEGSVGGSPPESDEDEPSVILPHSAVKVTQRPVNFVEGEDDRSSIAGSVLTSGSNVTRKTPRGAGGGRAAWAERKDETFEVRTAVGSEKKGNTGRFHGDNWVRGKETAPMGWGGAGGVTAGKRVNANEIPLGSRVSDRRVSEEIHGFKKYQPNPRLTPGGRRETPEYQKLRAFNPPPCHSLHIIGTCENRSWSFGHSYEIGGKEREMLKVLAKGLKCIMRDCRRRERDCLYSHKCPRGR